MKKSLMSLLTLCLLLSLLAGCGGHNPTNVPDNPSDPLPAQTAGEEDRTDPADPNNHPRTISSSNLPENPTVAEVCAGFRDDYDTWKGQYEKPDTFWVTIDGTDYYYWHTYPSNEWTPEEVAEHFREHPAYWGDDPTVPYGEAKTFYLWTPDYSQKFVADTTSNWLLINDLKAAPLDNTAYSMDPKDLIEAYQSKEWDGTTPARSTDFSTEVIIDQDYGLLSYSFDSRKFNEDKDPDHVAWANYVDARPWWEDASKIRQYTITRASSHILDDPWTISGYNSWDYNDKSEYYYISEAWAVAYPDVPWQLQNTLLAVQNPNVMMGDYLSHALRAQRNSDGLHALVTTGAQLWRNGFLRQNWEFSISADAHIVALDKGFIVYSNGQLLELFDDGTIEVLIDNIVSINMDNFYSHYSPCPSFTLKNGTLSFSSIDDVYTGNYASYVIQKRGGSTYEVETTEIAKNVVAADLTDYHCVLYTDATGQTYIIYDFMGSDAGITALHEQTYEVACLGKGSIDHFKSLWDTYCTEHNSWGQSKFIEEITGIAPDTSTTDGIDTDETPNAAV